VLLCGFPAPPLLERPDEREFASMYRELAEQHHVRRLPNLVVDVWNTEGLTLGDTIHPNAAGARKIAELVYRHTRLMLRTTGPPLR
jgi:acyl-CoA thioesterase I